MSFEEYLISKNINGSAFQLAEPARFQEWEKLFSEISPDSFTAQKKFLINDTRRRFLLVSAA